MTWRSKSNLWPDAHCALFNTNSIAAPAHCAIEAEEKEAGVRRVSNWYKCHRAEADDDLTESPEKGVFSLR